MVRAMRAAFESVGYWKRFSDTARSTISSSAAPSNLSFATSRNSRNEKCSRESDPSLRFAMEFCLATVLMPVSSQAEIG